jgi:hypothetical protein
MVSEHQELIGIMNILQTRCVILDSNPFMTITNMYVSMLTTLRSQCVNLKCLLMPSLTGTVTSSKVLDQCLTILVPTSIVIHMGLYVLAHNHTSEE